MAEKALAEAEEAFKAEEEVATKDKAPLETNITNTIIRTNQL